MSTLHIVATPIGNLEDITLRAVRILKEVDVVLAEDTRVTKKLFAHYDVHTPLERLDAAVEGDKIDHVINLLKDQKTVALVSDAGTPNISDPGARLVTAVREAGFEVVAVPGPSALTAALSISGVLADHFTFLGFPPQKKGRETFFNNLKELDGTVVLYESPHRVLKTLTAIGEREVIVAREITKMHEEVLTGTGLDIVKQLEKTPEKQKGEFVVIVSGK